MAIAFGGSFVLGLSTARIWIAICLSAMLPAVATLMFYGIPLSKDIGPAFSLIGPFLVAGTIWYAIIGLGGARLGRMVRAQFEKAKQTKADTDRKTGNNKY